MGSSAAGAAGADSAASAAGFSRGATGVGSSIFGGFSSTLGGVLCSALGLGLKKSPTRAERRRPTLAFFSSFFSSFLRVISQDITFGDVGFTAYLLFLGGLGLRSRLTGRLGSRRLGGSSGLAVDRVSFPADDAIDGNVLTSPSRAQRAPPRSWGPQQGSRRRAPWEPPRPQGRQSSTMIRQRRQMLRR